MPALTTEPIAPSLPGPIVLLMASYRLAESLFTRWTKKGERVVKQRLLDRLPALIADWKAELEELEDAPGHGLDLEQWGRFCAGLPRLAGWLARLQGVAEQHPAPSLDYAERPLPATPRLRQVADPEKRIRILRQRWKAGQSLFHPLENPREMPL